ncbi:MAG TPA: glycogen/starch/alpha-glucan family phosphorylase [Oscillospiraceae bacterium]|nr:glycogen/starch/alpha-glucan family phosphorylase [Oscillospiraceae bacterium]
MKNAASIISFVQDILTAYYQKTISTANVYEMHNALSRALMGSITEKWRLCARKCLRVKRAYYLSSEFLLGRAIDNNLLALGLTSEVALMLREQGFDIARFDEIDDVALGSSGLGRLAACFLDSAATHGYPLDGYGIRYKYGLFAQNFIDGFQNEEPDNWSAHGDPWSIRRDEDALIVKFSGQTVRAVPYDMPIIGYTNTNTNTNANVNTLRLWQSEPMDEYDLDAFNEQKYELASREKERAQDITRVLYPSDSTNEGKLLRIKQEYFLCSASIQDIVRRHVSKWGLYFENFHEYCAIQLNDTHPAVSICELIRILCEDYDLSFNKALYITQCTFSYTNHTVMLDALEQWSCRLYKKVLPNIYEYMMMISNHQTKTFNSKGGIYKENLDSCRIIKNGSIHMANLSIYCSSYVNGVAEFHTQILKNDLLKAWYEIYPDRFQNKTNGITPRRWLKLCNPELSDFITNQLGTDAWIKDLKYLKGLKRISNDEKVIDEFMAVKRIKKRQLSEYIQKHEGINLPADFIFDVQVKLMHEYKRQLLNAFSILDIYFGIKDGRIKDFAPTAFIFGAKAPHDYFRAKGIIKFINEIARMINNDTQTQEYLRVIFVRNYNVSYAQMLIPAADLSEQISTAGTEASGTGNMKFMLNGAPTIGTLDGANIEIVKEAGYENNYIFGARIEELEKIKDTYTPLKLYNTNPRIKRVLDVLIEGTVSDDGSGMFKDIYTSLLSDTEAQKADMYFVLHDFEGYVAAKLKANNDYKDTRTYHRKGLLNIAGAGKFSSDRTVEEYAHYIWNIGKI